jgi:Ni,Fe-hydrogenase maturation factor
MGFCITFQRYCLPVNPINCDLDIKSLLEKNITKEYNLCYLENLNIKGELMPTTIQEENNQIDAKDIIVDYVRIGSDNPIVRIYHKPSNICVQSSEKRSMHRNRLDAMQKLKDLLEKGLPGG